MPVVGQVVVRSKDGTPLQARRFNYLRIWAGYVL